MADKFTPFNIEIISKGEEDALTQLLDAAQRHLGISGNPLVNAWLRKIGSAQKAAQDVAEQLAAVASLPPAADKLPFVKSAKSNGKRPHA